MSERPINLPLPGKTSSQQDQLSGDLKKYEKAAEQYTKAKKKFYKEEKKHFYDDGKNEGNFMQDTIGVFTNELQGYASELGSMDMQSIFMSLLGNKLGTNFGTGMFGGMQQNFSTVMKSLMSMFLTDRKMTYDFIDYSKVDLKRHLVNADEYIDQLSTEITTFFDRYATLTEEGLTNWVTNYGTFLKSANEHFTEASIRMKYVEEVLINHKVLDTPNQEMAISELASGILELRGHMPEIELSSIVTTQEAINELFRELQDELDVIETARKNHVAMPSTVAEQLKVKSILGLESLQLGISLLEDLKADIDIVRERASTADVIVNQSINPWVASADATKAILLQLSEEVDPDLTGPEYAQVVSVSSDLDAASFDDELTQLVDDIGSLSTFLAKAFGSMKVSNLEPLRTRIQLNLASLKTKMSAITTGLQIPDALNPSVSSMVGEVNSFGFDTMLQALLSGDILGFLMSKFGMSTSGGQMITLLSQMIQGGIKQDSIPELVFFYVAAKKDVMRKENSSRARIDPFKDIYAQGLEKYQQFIEKKLQKLKQGVGRAQDGVSSLG